MNVFFPYIYDFLQGKIKSNSRHTSNKATCAFLNIHFPGCCSAAPYAFHQSTGKQIGLYFFFFKYLGSSKFSFFLFLIPAMLNIFCWGSYNPIIFLSVRHRYREEAASRRRRYLRGVFPYCFLYVWTG